MRLRFPLLFAASVSFAVLGCSLITSLDGLQGGPGASDAGGDGSKADGAATDAPADVYGGPTPVGDYSFAHHWATNARATSTAVLGAGGFVVATKYNGSIAVGPYFPPVTSPSAGLLVTLDATGGLTGATAIGVNSGLSFDAVAAGGSSVYVAGFSGATFQLNGTTVPAGVFIAKLSAGDLKKAPAWVHLTTNVRRLCGTCLRATSGGVVAFLEGTDTFVLDVAHTYASHGDVDLALAKFDDTTGATVWASQMGSTAVDGARALAVDPQGGVHVALDIGAALTPGEALGASPPPPVGTLSTLVVASFDAGGKVLPGAHSFGDSSGGSVSATCIDGDASGHVLVGGILNGGVDFGKGKTGSKGGSDGFVFVQDAAGTTLWQQTFGDVGLDDVGGCAIDPWGHVVVAGGYSASPTIGATKLPAVTSPGFYTAKMSQTGSFDWAHGYPGRDADGGTNAISAGANHLVIAPDGTIVVSGSLLNFAGVDFGGGPLYGTTEPDALVAGFRP